MPRQILTKEQILKEIGPSYGVCREIARRLNVTRQCIEGRIKKDPELEAACKNAKEDLIDIAESKLAAATKAGKPWAVRFVLARLGKDRGYTTLVNLKGNIENSGQVHVYLPDDGRDGGADGSTSD